MQSLYDRLLQLTETIERQLETEGDFNSLMPLLNERRHLFNALQASPLQQDTEEVIKQILTCEQKCIAHAMERKKKIHEDLQAIRNKKRLHQAYGKNMATR